MSRINDVTPIIFISPLIDFSKHIFQTSTASREWQNDGKNMFAAANLSKHELGKLFRGDDRGRMKTRENCLEIQDEGDTQMGRPCVSWKADLNTEELFLQSKADH